MISAHDMLERFEQARRLSDGSWLATCPAHEDRTPSLHVTLKPDRWLLDCKAGCAFETVVAEARLDVRDLFEENGNGQREVAETYDYTDESGELLFQVVRFEPMDFRQRRPDGNGGWLWNLKGTRRVPYRLPTVIEANKQGETIFVVEGEKDVHALERLGGLVATCNPMGAGKWRPEFSEALRGADVAVVADRDDAGRQHAAEVARALRGVAADVSVLEPTKGKDVAEHLANGGQTDELVTVEPSTSISTERTERSGDNPRHERDLTVRSGTERSPNGDRSEPPKLAFGDHILDHHDKLMKVCGLVGERHVSRCTYLVHISRLLADPSRMVVKGDSSTGKSFATECSLKAAAPEALYVRTQTSPLALVYSEEDFRHKTLVFYEANKLGDDDDPLARVLRTLISEKRLKYEVTVPEKRSSQLLEKEGPVAFISTTCKVSLDKEIETRLLSLHSDNSDDQTKAVVASILDAAVVGTPTEPDLSERHALDRWLAAGGPCDVVVPWRPRWRRLS
jgi:5S rRNA maturation endonuclease (ribonuclease M5)